jgi:hypothetical protein
LKDHILLISHTLHTRKITDNTQVSFSRWKKIFFKENCFRPDFKGCFVYKKCIIQPLLQALVLRNMYIKQSIRLSWKPFSESQRCINKAEKYHYPVSSSHIVTVSKKAYCIYCIYSVIFYMRLCYLPRVNVLVSKNSFAKMTKMAISTQNAACCLSWVAVFSF